MPLMFRYLDTVELVVQVFNYFLTLFSFLVPVFALTLVSINSYYNIVDV